MVFLAATLPAMIVPGYTYGSCNQGYQSFSLFFGIVAAVLACIQWIPQESRGRLFDDGHAHLVPRLCDQSGGNYLVWERVADVDPVDSEPGPRADPVHIAHILRGQEMRRETKAEADI